MIKQDYLIRMILEIITKIAEAILGKKKIKPQSWVEYDALTRQILGLTTEELRSASAEEILSVYEKDLDRWGKTELAAMTLLKIADETEDDILLKQKFRQDGLKLLKCVQSDSSTFSLQRTAIISLLESEDIKINT